MQGVSSKTVLSLLEQNGRTIVTRKFKNQVASGLTLDDKNFLLQLPELNLAPLQDGEKTHLVFAKEIGRSTDFLTKIIQNYDIPRLVRKSGTRSVMALDLEAMARVREIIQSGVSA